VLPEALPKKLVGVAQLHGVSFFIEVTLDLAAFFFDGFIIVNDKILMINDAKIAKYKYFFMIYGFRG